ncbi:MAG: glycosyltransferase family 2 protein [Candidatus Latescibacter sp.]|nr:glycosyltransferase family 2 protein [Candidatus Latescibacter sp.]
MLPKVSIIIAVGIPGRYVEECVARCLALDSPDFEIIVLPDSEWTPPDRRVRVIPTGKVRPAEKRDCGVENAAGEIGQCHLKFIGSSWFKMKYRTGKTVSFPLLLKIGHLSRHCRFYLTDHIWFF